MPMALISRMQKIKYSSTTTLVYRSIVLNKSKQNIKQTNMRSNECYGHIHQHLLNKIENTHVLAAQMIQDKSFYVDTKQSEPFDRLEQYAPTVNE